jgi:hypothetical protein
MIKDRLTQSRRGHNTAGIQKRITQSRQERNGRKEKMK